MNEERFTPDEFARLLSLPEGHPDRQRAEKTAQFQAWRLMLREFEQPSGSVLPAGEVASAGRELEARLAGTVGAVGGNGAGAPRPRAEPGSWTDGLMAWLRGPAMRPALAFAAVAIVAGITLWSTSRGPAPRAVRGGGETMALVLSEPRAISNGIELTWTPVAGAEAYRVVFYGADLKESAHVDGLVEARLVLRAGSLPSGLTGGAEVLAEVTALRNGDPIATSKAQALHLP